MFGEVPRMKIQHFLPKLIAEHLLVRQKILNFHRRRKPGALVGYARCLIALSSIFFSLNEALLWLKV